MNDQQAKTSDSNQPFKWILGVSFLMLFIFMLFGFLHRWISPVERDLEESEYIEKVFVENETEVWDDSPDNANKLGTFEGGSVLFVIKESGNRIQVRPKIVSALDSVWIDRSHVILYADDVYREWQYAEERRKYDWDE